MLIKLFVFFLFIWVLAVGPLLYGEFFLSTEEWIVSSLVVGTGNALCVSLILLVIYALRRKFKIPTIGICLSSLYLIPAVSLFAIGLFRMADEPLIWEAVVPLIILLCPVSDVVSGIRLVSGYIQIFFPITFGALYYYILGDLIFEKFIGRSDSQAGRK